MVKTLLSVAIVLGSCLGAAQAEQKKSDPTPAQKLAPILPAQPPVVSTGTANGTIGQPINGPGGYKPTGPSVKPKPVPSPGSR
jgi:hypothetical protein